MLDILVNVYYAATHIVPLAQASWDSGLYSIDRNSLKGFLETFVESKGVV